MNRRMIAAALGALLMLLPISAWAGGEWVDPLDRYGIRSALEGTKWAGEEGDSVYYNKTQSAEYAAAVLETANERSLLLFQNSGQGWKITHTLTDAVCQGQNCGITVWGGQEWGDAEWLTLSHSTGIYTHAYYDFRKIGDQWVFECARLYSPTAEMGDEDFYEQPKRVAYYTWQNGALKVEYYLEDLYGKLTGEKIAQPGEGYWVRDTVSDELIPWNQNMTLENFALDAFPKDEYSLSWTAEGGDSCAWKLGELDPDLHYAVVNNPNPKDRLNLREEPDSSSHYMGKYYNGTLVRVIERRDDGWVKVFLLGNNCIGYMREEYLAFDKEMETVENVCPVFTAPSGEWNLLYGPFETSHVKASFSGGETFEVLGFVEGWWHIQVNSDTDLRGYIREYVSLE